MNWKEKISQGMQLIKEGCKENTSWMNCHQCPLDDLCTILEHNNLNNRQLLQLLPSEWFGDEEEEEE